MPTNDVPAPAHSTRALSRRGLLRVATITGGGLIAAVGPACAPAAKTAGWTYGPSIAPNGPGASLGPSSAPASPVATSDQGHVMPSGLTCQIKTA